MNALCTVLVLTGVLASGCSRPVAATRAAPPAALAPAPDAPDHPDTIAYARRLIVDSRTGLLRALVDRLAARVRSHEPVDSLALVRVMELWAEYASQPHSPPDSAAHQWARVAVRVKERELGPDHHELAHSLATLAAAADAARDPARAVGPRERAVRILRAKRGPERAGLMTALDDLGRSAYWQNQPARAESLMREAVAEGRAAGLSEQPRFQSVLNNLAVVLEQRGKLAEALEIQEDLLELRTHQFGPVHRRVQLTRINLGSLYWSLARYEEALAHTRAALTLDSLLDGQGASRRETVLQNLAGLLDAMGDIASGRRLLEGAIQAQADTAWYLQVLLADSHRKTGDHTRARELYRKGLQGLRATQGLRTHQATALSGLARIEEDEDRTDRAIALHLESLALRLEVHGPGHASTAGSLLALARCELARDRLDEGAAYADSADRVLRRARPARHPDRAEALVARARVLELRERAGEAVALLDSADALIRDTFGPEHPRRAAVLGDIARLAVARGGARRALEAAVHAAAIQRRAARIALESMTESEALAYAASDVRQLDALLEHARALAERAPEAADLAFDETIRSRALILDAAVARRRGPARAAASDTARTAVERARRRLARLWVAGLRDRSPATHRALLDSARAQVDRAEKAVLGPLTGGPRGGTDPPGLPDVRAALPSGSALISYIRYRSAQGDRRDARYLAFALQAGEEHPVIVPLATAAAIDSAIERWRRAAEIRPVETAAAEARYRRVAAELRRLVWDPLASRLPGATRLFVVPDGQLQLVDLAVLPTDDGRYLVESAPPIALLTSELDLLAGPLTEPGSRLVALGDPEFDAGPPTEAGEAAVVRGGPDGCEEFARRAFARLPASAREVREVADAWTVAGSGRTAVVLRGHEATEARLREAAPGATDLHIATHGFFLPQRCGIEAGLAPAEGTPALADGAAGTALLRAGLALAGANRRLAVAEGEDDGILTAEEIAALDLRRTRSVVLSACEAGQGESVPGEGVFGLRRALRLAGARSMVMSLWRMDDAQAREWASRYYAARWKEGLDAASAAQAASRELLSYWRRRSLPAHPARWGGFIAVGRE